jgi:hypothetical protein
MSLKNQLKGEIVRRSGTLQAFCLEKGLSYTRFSRVLNGRMSPNDRERQIIADLWQRARTGFDEAIVTS